MKRHAFAFLISAALAGLPAGAALAQTGSIEGTVRSAVSGQPVANARVSVLGQDMSVLTDADGHFVIPNVPIGTYDVRATLLGYAPVTLTGVSVETGLTATANLEMRAAAIQLQEVVVTALGIEREQRSLSYSAQTISEETLTDVPKTNLLASLQGNAAGVHVTNGATAFGSARIVVRGASSILGQNQPLIVVDGIPIDNYAATLSGYGGGDYGGYDAGNAASEINPNNIASLTVLKGPNAAALYGSRAGNGAIVITTKRGEGAAANGGFGITATVGTMFETPLRLPNYQNQYGQGFYGEFDFVDGNFGGLNDGADESWGPKMDGRTTGCVYNAAGTAYDTSVPCHQFFGEGPWEAHPNNVRDFWDTGVVTNMNVAVARASDRSNVRLSIGRTDESGMYPSNTNRRTDVALAGGSQISDRWSAEASINYINSNFENQPKQSYDDAAPMQNFIWFGRQVDVGMLKDNLYRNPDDALTKQILAGTSLRTDTDIPYSWNYSYHQNPFWEASVKTTDFERNRGLGHASVTYKVADWLSATGRMGRDWYQSHFRANYPVNNIDPYALGGVQDVGDTRSETNMDFLLTANRQLVEDLGLTVNAGGNLRKSRIESNTGSGSQLVIPGVYTLENAANQSPPQLRLYEKNVNSLYGSASFNYKDWFNVDLTGRNDWSSTLPDSAKSFFYPSVGAALIFTDMLGWYNNSFLSYGKLRASWTRVGNDTDPYQLQAVYGAGRPWGGLPTFSAPNRLPNAALKPEQTTAYEVGGDFGLLDNRVTLNATWYQKSTRDQILPVSISSATGFTQAVVNSGDVRNRGFELAATIVPVETRDFRWSLVVNWAKNTNKVLSLYSGVQRIVIGSFWNVNVTADSGQAYGNLVGYKWQRDAQGRIVVDDDGYPVRDPTQQVLGNYNPDWVGGISTTLGYRSLSLSLAFDGQHGGEVYSVTKWFGQYSGVLEATLLGRENEWDDGLVVPNSVHEDGSPNTTSILAQDYWHNTFYAQEEGIFDATYLKLRDARLSVELPSAWAEHLGFSGMNLSLVGHNLALWTKQKTIDPETTFDTGNRQGVENAQLPTARSYGFTLSVRP